MPELINNKKANFGTMPVFVTAISTILGAVLFLRFGYAIGHTGLIPENISKISCLSGGIVCQKVGVVPINKEELLSKTIKIF